MIGPSCSDGQKLPPQEWDFSNVLDADLRVAVWWEFLRTIPEVLEAARIYKLGDRYVRIASRGEIARSCINQMPLEISLRVPIQFWDESEWPAVPFPSLSGKRCQELRPLGLQEHELGYELEYGLDDLERDVRARARDLLRNVKSSGESIRVSEANSEQWIPRRIWSEEPPIDLRVAMLAVDWSKPDEELVTMFRVWLHLRRPDDVTVVETRGPAGVNSKRGRLLKKLGAFRLLRTMTWREAFCYTEDILGKPLYSEYEHVWTRAASEAGEQVKRLREFVTSEYWLPIDYYLIRQELGGLL